MKLRMIFILVALLLPFSLFTQAQDVEEPNIGETITIEGEVQEILGPNSFTLERTDPFDFTPSEVVVFNDDNEPFAVDINVGRTVQVTGTVQAMDLNNVINQIEYEIETALFGNYDTDDYALVATSVSDASTMGMAADFDYDPEIAAAVEADPTAYVGDTFTVEGYVAEILGPESFRLTDTQPFDLTPSSFIVINDDSEPFAVDVNVGRYLRVTGMLQSFDVEVLDAEVDYVLDPDSFVDFDTNDYTMIAESVMAVSAPNANTVYDTIDPTMTEEDTVGAAAFVSMDDIEDDPLAYIGQTVTVEGEIEQTYSADSFLLEEDEFFDLDPLTIPVFGAEGMFSDTDEGGFLGLNDDPIYSVTGEIVAWNLADIETVLGYTLDPDLYVDFNEDDIAIIATSVTALE